MKKVILTLCTGIIMCGAAYSLYNAANDYGVATISLPPGIIAQDDDTSGGDNTNDGKIECNGTTVLCSSYLNRHEEYKSVKSNSEGVIEVAGKTLGGYKKNTSYVVRVTYFSCVGQPEYQNICVKAEEKSVINGIKDGSATNGDSTEGN